ncbi:hypothetical protein [Streptomyces sp. NPDC050264]|uniref:hypothetical protein n=1 Tax=Streptomyces sp. NPDC050264 TaxID=3155038 RepID=UPI0034293D65
MAITAGVVAASAATALVLRPGEGPLGHLGIVTIVIVAVWAVGLMLGMEQLRDRIGARRATVPPAEERLRRAAPGA